MPLPLKLLIFAFLIIGLAVVHPPTRPLDFFCFTGAVIILVAVTMFQVMKGK